MNLLDLSPGRFADRRINNSGIDANGLGVPALDYNGLDGPVVWTSCTHRDSNCTLGESAVHVIYADGVELLILDNIS